MIECGPSLVSSNLGDGDLGDNPAMLCQLRDDVWFTRSHLRQTDRPEGWREAVACENRAGNESVFLPLQSLPISRRGAVALASFSTPPDADLEVRM